MQMSFERKHCSLEIFYRLFLDGYVTQNVIYSPLCQSKLELVSSEMFWRMFMLFFYMYWNNKSWGSENYIKLQTVQDLSKKQTELN